MPGQVDEYKKNIGFQGGLSFLICSITGPGILTIPSLFHTAGWLFPMLTFILVAVLSAMSCLFLIEAMTYFPGNKYFERNVEFTVLVHHFYGKRWYYLMHVIMYGSLQSFNIASIITAVQSFDTFILALFGGTCGVGLSPISGLYCVYDTTGDSSPFGSNFMFITAGGLLFAVFIIPLMSLNIDDNMIFQWVSLVYMFFIVFLIMIVSFVHGLTPSLMPAVGDALVSSPPAVIGQVLFNFTLANTIPSWVNTSHPKVSVSKCVWYSVVLSTILYCLTGLFGALSFDSPDGSNLLSVMTHVLNDGSIAGLVNFMNFSYPILVLLTSIPVSIIIIKLNLITSRLCSRDWASFWASVVPFVVCIPLQTGTYINDFSNWTSLIFQSLCNFIAPFLIYIFLDKRNMVMQQSVLDELENLDLDGGLKKRVRDDDDDFDYVYHLPHADLSRLGDKRYDPFKHLDQPSEPTGLGFGGSRINRRRSLQPESDSSKMGGSTNSVNGIQIAVPALAASSMSLQSEKQKRRALLDGEVNETSTTMRRRLVGGKHGFATTGERGSRVSLTSEVGKVGNSSMNMSLYGGQSGGGGGNVHGGLGAGPGMGLGGGLGAGLMVHQPGRRPSSMIHVGAGGSSLALGPGGAHAVDALGRGPEARLDIGVAGIRGSSTHSANPDDAFHSSNSAKGRRQSGAEMSTYSRSTLKRVHPGGPRNMSVDYMTEPSLTNVDIDDRRPSDVLEDMGPPSFKALPEWITRRISSRNVAIICLVTTSLLTGAVLIFTIVTTALGN